MAKFYKIAFTIIIIILQQCPAPRSITAITAIICNTESVTLVRARLIYYSDLNLCKLLPKFSSKSTTENIFHGLYFVLDLSYDYFSYSDNGQANSKYFFHCVYINIMLIIVIMIINYIIMYSTRI